MGSSKPTPKQGGGWEMNIKVNVLDLWSEEFESDGVVGEGEGAVRQPLQVLEGGAVQESGDSDGEGAVKEGGEGTVRQALQECGSEGCCPAGALGRRQGGRRSSGAPGRR